MPFKRWCRTVAVVTMTFLAGAASAECWNDLENLPSDTSATEKINAILACAVDQGLELDRLRSAIDDAEQASAVAGVARDAAIGAVAEISDTADELAALTVLLERQINPWVQETRSFREIIETAAREDRDEVPMTEREIGRYEFALFRNGGFRVLTFSNWNGGIRVMTDSYIRGDHPDYSLNSEHFALGGSFWVFETDDESDDCPGEDEVHHYYYEYQADGVRIRSRNGCRVEPGPIFRRDRLFSMQQQ